MKEKEIKAKYPDIDMYELVQYLRKNKLDYSVSFSGSVVVEEEHVEAYLHMLKNKDKQIAEDAARKVEEAAIAAEERKKKNKAMSQMLITSGFNFDGYTIKKYSGYISGDDAISVDRGVSFWGIGGAGARDDLMASLAKIRRNALRELKEAAYDLGCNAVIGVDFDYITLDPQTHNIGGGTKLQPYVFGVTANGNAVIIEKDED